MCLSLFRMCLGFISLPTHLSYQQASSKHALDQRRGLQLQLLPRLLELSCRGTMNLASRESCSTSRVARKLFTNLTYFIQSASALARITQPAAWLTCKNIAMGLRLMRGCRTFRRIIWSSAKILGFINMFRFVDFAHGQAFSVNSIDGNSKSRSTP